MQQPRRPFEDGFESSGLFILLFSEMGHYVLKKVFDHYVFEWIITENILVNIFN